jgi:nicotinate-nucleotide pyrophosphorylase (carboxylating)
MKPPNDTFTAGVISLALKEDTAFNDVTTLSVIGAASRIKGRFVAKHAGVVCGLGIAAKVFSAIDTAVTTTQLVKDGSAVKAGTVIALVNGPARAIISGERTALNFLQHLSGIATFTRSFVDALKGTGVKIYDTRKTVPGLRALAKYAVACGGGTNHRMNLATMAMLKDNHLALMKDSVNNSFAENLSTAILAIRKKHPGIKVEVECDTLAQLTSAIATKPDVIMLDNMSPAAIRKAIKVIRAAMPRPLIEISGGINLKTVRKYAISGADYISIGAITHSAPALDISLDIGRP